MYVKKPTLRQWTPLMAGILILCAPWLTAADFSKYHNYKEMTGILKSLAGNHGDTATLHSLGKSIQGRDIWLMEIASPGKTPPLLRPALFIGAALEGDHLIGSELALFTINHLLEQRKDSSEIKKLLQEHTFYILPRANPDGTEEMFARIATGKRTNASPRDDDNDGRLDEDGPEDLNGDGEITLMRRKEPEGLYMEDEKENRLLKKADPNKGEEGIYTLYWEGIDNDGDGFINEDPAGGVDLNRNFQHEYPYYQPDAGPHMISEPETRAIMDWVIGHRNIALFLTYGESDNLVTPPNNRGQLGQPKEIDLFRFADTGNEESRKAGMMEISPFGFGRGRRMGMGGFMFTSDMFRRMNERSSQVNSRQAGGRWQRPDRKAPTAVNKDDIGFFKSIGEKYVEITGIKQVLTARNPQGAFFQYGYYQYGVPAFCTPGWGLAQAEKQGFSRQGGTAGMTPDRARAGGGERQADVSEFNFQTMAAAGRDSQAPAVIPGVDKQVLAWLEKEKIDGFVDWKPFKHPELGDVEIGGFKPYVLTNPPAAKISELGAAHAEFAAYLPSLFPRVRIDRHDINDLGGGLFRIKIDVANHGILPTALAHAVTARAVKPTLVQIEVPPDNILTGNSKTNFIPCLSGSGGRESFDWIIRGKKGERIQVRVVSQNGGSDTLTLVLK